MHRLAAIGAAAPSRFGCFVNVTARFAPTVLSFENRAICASMRPLDNLQIVFGAQSCATRLVFKASARLAGA
ncbi:MAG: hypothetical protein J6U17_04960, partial [Kiritimatiellae bacterium]|nr:hypothetical protein [Kiritimatiellia bacterium]